MKSKTIGLMICALCTTLLTYAEAPAASSTTLRADAGAQNRAKAAQFAEQAKNVENQEIAEVYSSLGMNHARMAVIDNEIAAAGDAPYDMKEYRNLEASNKELMNALRAHLRRNMQFSNSPTPVDLPKVDEPKVEVPKVEVPKVDVPKVEVPNVLPRPEMRNMPERVQEPRIRRTPVDM